MDMEPGMDTPTRNNLERIAARGHLLNGNPFNKYGEGCAHGEHWMIAQLIVLAFALTSAMPTGENSLVGVVTQVAQLVHAK